MRLGLLHCGEGIQPPLGIAYIAAYVRKYGNHKVQIVDLGAGQDVSEMQDCDYLGVTTTTPWFTKTRQQVKQLRERFPGVPIIVGGAHVTALPDTVKDDLFDIAVIGEGEQTTLEILDGNPLNKIKGIVYKQNNRLMYNEPRPLIEELDKIPFPARDLLQMDEYYLKPSQVIRGILRRSTQMMSSRGCPYNCVFCGSCKMWQRKIRFYSPDYVIAELKELIDKYKVDGIFFQDDMLSVGKERLEEICSRMVSEGISDRIVWSCQLRANIIDKEKIDIIKKAGCSQAEFGFESGCEKTLKYLKGNSVTVEQNRQAIRMCNEANIRVLGNFIIGAPDETEEDIMETMDFIRANKISSSQMYVLSPFPGSQIWELVKDRPEATNWENYSMGGNNSNVLVANKIGHEELIDLYKKLTEEINKMNYGQEVFKVDYLFEPSVMKRAISHPMRTLKRLGAMIKSRVN